MSGPHNPQDPPELLASFAVTSGPHNPQDPPRKIAAFADLGSAAPQPAPAPETQAQVVSVKVVLKKALPIAVSISSPDAQKIKLQKVVVEIFQGKDPVFSTLLSAATNVAIDDATNPHVFTFNSEELTNAMPHLKVGNLVNVRVEYLAETQGELHVGIVAHHESHSIADVLHHLLQHP